MARIRTIKPDFFTSEDIMALSPLARLLYIGTWLEADREGRLAWKPATLKVRYLPSDACDVAALAAELVDRGLIVPYGEGLAFIPSFKDHQYINGKESPSRLVAPTEESINASVTRAGRVTDAPSFPSYIPSVPSLPDGVVAKPERTAIQGTGAYEPGSLPRDHVRHALCGPLRKICLKQWEYDVLAKAYNQPDNPHGTRALLSQFIEQLERNVTPNDPIGPFGWVEKNFHTWLKSKGKVPADLKVGKSINDEIDEWARS